MILNAGIWRINYL